MDAIRNVNEPLSPFKVMRNHTGTIIKTMPGLFVQNLVLSYDIWSYLGLCAGEVALCGACIFIVAKKYGDADFKRASNNLHSLVQQLDDLHVSTDYDLLLKSEVYLKKHKIELNEKKIPLIVEEKYILVPTYNYNGDIKDTSILQEHIVGSKEYVLSLGSPKKEFKLAYSNT